MLNSISIKSRLIALVLVPAIILVLISWYLMGSLTHTRKGVHSLYDHHVVPLKNIKITSDLAGILAVDSFVKYKGGILSAEELDQTLTNVIKDANLNWNAYMANEFTPEESNLAEEADRLLKQAKTLIVDWQNLARRGELKSMETEAFDKTLFGTMEPLSHKLEELIELQLAVAEEFVLQTEHESVTIFKVLSISLTIIIIVMIGMGFAIAMSIQRPLESMSNKVIGINQNLDLTQRLTETGNDEITAVSIAFNGMLTRFQRLIGSLTSSIEQSSVAAEQMSAIATAMQRTVNNQHEQVQSVATAVTEMSGAVQEVAQNASLTAEAAKHVNDLSSKGKEKVASNQEGIQNLSNSISRASLVIQTVNEHSDKIGEILSVITQIAEQTNLLALNAAIESARAGEAGRGFAVVADEVRNLAKSTHEATENIREMISQLQTSSNEAVSTMKASKDQADVSVNNSNAAFELLNQIALAINEISDMNIQVSTATEEQAAVANEVNENVERFNVGINEISENATHSATASEELARLAVQLKEDISVFKA